MPEPNKNSQRKKKKSLPQPSITVITVVKNSGKDLNTTIDSVSEQTYDNIEFIIIDGASSDTTPKGIDPVYFHGK